MAWFKINSENKSIFEISKTRAVKNKISKILIFFGIKSLKSANWDGWTNLYNLVNSFFNFHCRVTFFIVCIKFESSWTKTVSPWGCIFLTSSTHASHVNFHVYTWIWSHDKDWARSNTEMRTTIIINLAFVYIRTRYKNIRSTLESRFTFAILKQEAKLNRIW